MQLELADNGTRRRTILDHMLKVMDENGNIIWIREDQLDDNTDEDLYEIVMSQPHLADGLGAFEGMKARKDLRLQKKAAKVDKQAAKAENIRAGVPGAVERTVGTVVDKVSGIFNRDVPAPIDTRSFDFPMITGGANVGVNKWYQNPLTLGAIAVGGLLLTVAITRTVKHQNS